MENTQTWLELGKLYQKLELADKAAEIYQNLYDCGERSTDLLNHLFTAAIEAKDIEKASQVAVELTSKMPDNQAKANILMELGKLYFASQDGNNALLYMNQALALDPSLANQIPAMVNDDRPVNQEIAETLTTTTASTNGDANIEENQEGLRLTMLLTMGIMHWRNGQLEDADDVLTMAIRDAGASDNKWIEALAWHSLALVRTALGDIKGAIDAYLKAAELAPNQIFPWNKVGALYENLDMNDEAQSAYQKSLMLNPEDPESWNGMGDLLTKHGKLDEAVACYQLGNVFDANVYGNDGIKVYQKALDYYRKTMTEFRQDTAKEAVVVEEQVQEPTIATEGEPVAMDEPKTKIVLEQEPVEPKIEEKTNPAPVFESVVDRPIAIEEADSLVVSIRKFEETVKTNPFNDRAWDSLGNLYKMKRWYEKAIFAYENAVAIQPRKHIYHFQLGSLYAAYGNFNVAITEMQKVLELDPTSTYAHCALANYFRRLGFPEKAAYHIDFALPFMKNEKEYDRACFESVRGETELALELLESALEKKQTSIELIQSDMDLDFIRQDPRFEALERKYAEEPVFAY